MTGEELHDLRQEAGLNARQLAKRLKVSTSEVFGWESDRISIPENMLGKIGKVIGDTIDPLPSPKRAYRKASGEKYIPKSTDSEDMIKKSTCGNPININETKVIYCGTIELGPETMKALSDLIKTAVKEMKMEPINPDVIAAKRDGDYYRAKTQEKLRR